MPADTAPAWPDRVWLHKSTSGQDDVWTDTPNGLDSPAYVREAAVAAREAAAWAAGAAAMRESLAGLFAEIKWVNLEREVRALPLPPMPGTTQGGNADE